jgi:hypothetical protein
MQRAGGEGVERRNGDRRRLSGRWLRASTKEMARATKARGCGQHRTARLGELDCLGRARGSSQGVGVRGAVGVRVVNEGERERTKGDARMEAVWGHGAQASQLLLEHSGRRVPLHELAGGSQYSGNQAQGSLVAGGDCAAPGCAEIRLGCEGLKDDGARRRAQEGYGRCERLGRG